MVPTLVVWGECDLIVPVCQAQQAVRLLSCDRLEIFPHSSHLPRVKAPENCVAALSDFLAGALC